MPEDGGALPAHSRSLAVDLREGCPLAMFNESLMEFFDACMANSEGQVKELTNFTKRKYSDIENLHSLLVKA